jgi:hypothetical protein
MHLSVLNLELIITSYQSPFCNAHLTFRFLFFLVRNCLTSVHFCFAEESLVIRSLVVTEGSIFVCIENLQHFGCFPDDSHPPYFSLDECCSIDSIKEVVNCAWLMKFSVCLGYFSLSIAMIFFSQSSSLKKMVPLPKVFFLVYDGVCISVALCISIFYWALYS